MGQLRAAGVWGHWRCRWEPYAPGSVVGWAALTAVRALAGPARPRPASGLTRSGPAAAQPSLTASPQTEEFFDLIASSQSRRLDDQRASVGSLPGLRITHNNLGHLRGDGDPQEPGDDFFNMLIKCQVGLQTTAAPILPSHAGSGDTPGAGEQQAGSASVTECPRVHRSGALLLGPPRECHPRMSSGWPPLTAQELGARGRQVLKVVALGIPLPSTSRRRKPRARQHPRAGRAAGVWPSPWGPATHPSGQG